jgi:ABC-type branched-subunit amino acid transport system ATPase component
MIALETKNISKHFDGVQAVDHISLAIPRGKVTAIIGPNGSGKTTLINLLTGITSVSNGSVIINQGVELNRIKPWTIASHGLTRTFQEVRLFNQMTVEDNILVVLTERKVARSLLESRQPQYLNRAKEILLKIDLWDKRHELAVNLSYGQRKLLEIARVLAMNSAIVLLDEPFAGLFPQIIKTVAAIIKELRRAGVTIILIEHNMNLIRELADEVIVMDEGKILAAGEPTEVLSQKEVIEAYLGD